MCPRLSRMDLDKQALSPLQRQGDRCRSGNWTLFLMKVIKLHPPPSKWAFRNFKFHLSFVLDCHVRLSACTWGLGPLPRAHMIANAFGQVCILASGPVQVQEEVVEFAYIPRGAVGYTQGLSGYRACSILHLQTSSIMEANRLPCHLLGSVMMSQPC